MVETPMDNRPNESGPAAGPAGEPGARSLDVVLVGAGERARAWLAPLRRSRRLRAIATVARSGEAVAADLPRYGSLEEVMRDFPAAVFAIALPPRAGLESALLLAGAGREAVVEAPLHDALLDAEPGPGAAGVRVAHGWVTLPGRRAVEALMRRAGGGQLTVEVAGLPEEDHGDLYEVLVHATALVRALLPEATAVAARQIDAGALEVDFAAPLPGSGWALSLRLVTRGQRLAVRMGGMADEVRWSWENDRESVMFGGAPLVAPRTTPAAAARALAQLLPNALRGDGLVEAAAALRLARSCLSLFPVRVAIGERSLRQSASIARRRPSDLLARLGLRGELPAGDPGPAPAVLTLVPPPEPFELWAFRAGVKPVVFLTVPPEDVERTLSFFGDAHCERRHRRVRVEAQDRWTDQREEGEPRVELYIARDAGLARQAAHLQAEVDPTRAARELGALVGYPACCVDAFARQDDRANNSHNRYHSQARTLAPDASTQAPWPWELNNLHTMIVPFYPCSYRCERALAWARAALAEMARVYPAFEEELRAALARPVLYFDHEHQLVLDGECAGGRVAYRGVAVPRPSSPQLSALAAAVGRGDGLSFDDRYLRVERDGEVILRLERTDPALGFIAPFGAA
jgi:hypothetical protein